MNNRKVLVVASSLDPYRELFARSKFEKPVLETSASAARRRLQNESFAIVLVAAPLQDEFGLQTANEIAGVYENYVLLFVPGDMLDQASYQCQEQTVFVLASPVNKTLSAQAISFLDKVYQQNSRLKRQLANQKQKMQDEKMIYLCKLKLIEKYHWSEQKAHSYIGKTAMDHSTTRVNVARTLLNKLES